MSFSRAGKLGKSKYLKCSDFNLGYSFLRCLLATSSIKPFCWARFKMLMTRSMIRLVVSLGGMSFLLRLSMLSAIALTWALLTPWMGMLLKWGRTSLLARLISSLWVFGLTSVWRSAKYYLVKVANDTLFCSWVLMAWAWDLGSMCFASSSRYIWCSLRASSSDMAG